MDPKRALDFIGRHQNADGGFGYKPGDLSVSEPTAFCAMALHSAGCEPQALRGLGFLKECLQGQGAVGLDRQDKEGNWMAYAALLAFQAFHAAQEVRRMTTWILGFSDASSRLPPASLAAIKADYRFDASIPGWPWTPGTSGWVEPTAMFLIALLRAGIARSHPRIRQGVALLIDRKIPSGGWNFGNPYSGALVLEPTLLSTILALTALSASGIGENEPAVRDGLRFVRNAPIGPASTVSLCWGCLAMKHFPSGRDFAGRMATPLAARQKQDGSYRQNLFETALAYVVLESPETLIRIEPRT